MAGVTTAYEKGKVLRSKVLADALGNETYILFKSASDGKNRAIVFKDVAVVLANDEIEACFPAGASWVVFQKMPEGWQKMVLLLREEYGIEVEQMTVEDIQKLEDEAARIDAEFAHEIKELDTITATKIYDVTRNIIYHKK